MKLTWQVNNLFVQFEGNDNDYNTIIKFIIPKNVVNDICLKYEINYTGLAKTLEKILEGKTIYFEDS